jgi:hypothetical protein
MIEMTYPDAWKVSFGYDALNRVVWAEEGAVNENKPCASVGRTLASISYDLLSRRQSVTYGNGVVSSYDWSPRGDLLGLGNDFGFQVPNLPEVLDYDFT